MESTATTLSIVDKESVILRMGRLYGHIRRLGVLPRMKGSLQSLAEANWPDLLREECHEDVSQGCVHATRWGWTGSQRMLLLSWVEEANVFQACHRATRF